MRHSLFLVPAALLACCSLPASAELSASREAGFVSHNEVLVRATPEQTWNAILSPGNWWNGDHTYSGNAANLTITAKAGGCFCETVPGSNGAPAGEIEHMRVIYVAPASTLRLSGGLGPLQSEPVSGVLTMTLEPQGELTKITWDYVVGGYMRMPMAQLAPAVDQVVGEQLLRLATSLGTVMDPAARRAGS